MKLVIRNSAAGLMLACTSIFASAPSATSNLIADASLVQSATDANVADTLAAHNVAPSNRLRPVTGTNQMLSKLAGTQQPAKDYHKSTVVWGASVGAMLGATAMDAATSVGKYESNPLLRSADGKFGLRGMAIKGGLAGFTLIPQIFLRNHKELRTKLAIANFIQAGVFSGVAIHNLGIKVPQ